MVLNAAHVSLGLPYSILKASNVDLLLRVIQLCLDTGARLHFISSVGAMGNSRKEEVVPIPSQLMNAKNGYGQVERKKSMFCLV